MKATSMPFEKTITVLFRDKPHPITINHCSFQEFESIILSRLKIKSGIAIKYQDLDNDWIVVGCDDQVKEALSANAIMVCERADQNDERSIRPNMLSAMTSSPKKKSTLKQSAVVGCGNVVKATQFNVPDTAEMDRDLQIAHLRRLKLRAYESRSDRISRYASKESSAADKEPLPNPDKRRVRWEMEEGPEPEKVRQLEDHCSSPSAKTSPAAVCRRPSSPQLRRASDKVAPARHAPASAASPAPVQQARPLYCDAVVADGPRVLQHSTAVTSRQWDGGGERLAGLGFSLSPSAPFIIRSCSVLRDYKGIQQGDPGYFNEKIEPNDRCPAIPYRRAEGSVGQGSIVAATPIKLIGLT